MEQNMFNNAKVRVEQITNIKKEKLNYVVIETARGEVPISIGEKNYNVLQELLKPRETSTQIQVLPPAAEVKK